MESVTTGGTAAVVMDVNEATFQRDIVERSHEVPVVIDFWAPWCGPCRTLGPILEKLANEGRGSWVLAKINVDNNQRLAQMFGVQGIPAVKAVSQGRLVDEFVGAKPESQVRAWLKRFINEPQEVNPEVLEGPPADPAQAEAFFRKQLASGAGNDEVRFELGRVLLRQGKPEGVSVLSEVAEGTPFYSQARDLLPLGEFLNEAVQPPEASSGGWDSEHAYRLAAHAAKQGQFEQAMDALIAIVGRDRAFREDAARKTLLAIFALLGEENPLVGEYRRKLANVLF